MSDKKFLYVGIALITVGVVIKILSSLTVLALVFIALGHFQKLHISFRKSGTNSINLVLNY